MVKIARRLSPPASREVALVAGLWLLVAAAPLGYTNHPIPRWNDLIVGLLVLGNAIPRAAGEAIDWLRALNVGLGLWLVAAPFVLGYGAAPRQNDLVVGALVIAASAGALWAAHRPTAG